MLHLLPQNPPDGSGTATQQRTSDDVAADGGRRTATGVGTGADGGIVFPTSSGEQTRSSGIRRAATSSPATASNEQRPRLSPSSTAWQIWVRRTGRRRQSQLRPSPNPSRLPTDVDKRLGSPGSYRVDLTAPATSNGSALNGEHEPIIIGRSRSVHLNRPQ
ncbi:hypothetical protein ACLOJK_034888 [Asimina triloba]